MKNLKNMFKNGHGFFALALFFWLMSGLLKVLQMDVWVEKTSTYAYGLLLVGLAILFLEIYKERSIKK